MGCTPWDIGSTTPLWPEKEELFTSDCVLWAAQTPSYLRAFALAVSLKCSSLPFTQSSPGTFQILCQLPLPQQSSLNLLTRPNLPITEFHSTSHLF